MHQPSQEWSYTKEWTCLRVSIPNKEWRHINLQEWHNTIQLYHNPSDHTTHTNPGHRAGWNW